MKIRIAHLYPDLLNLYGENGNIKALKYALEQNNHKVSITNISLEDDIDPLKYDFIYIGSGLPNNLELVKSHLTKYKNEFLEYISQHKIMLITGNAVSLFPFLELYEVSYNPAFFVADVQATSSLCKGNIYAFQNTNWLINTPTKPIFNITTGYGNQNTHLEGYTLNNFYATTLIGPILARNHKLTTYFCNILTNKE